MARKQNHVIRPLAKPPFSDLHSNSVFGLFGDEQVQSLRRKIQGINRNAEADDEEMPLLMAAEPNSSYGE